MANKFNIEITAQDHAARVFAASEARAKHFEERVNRVGKTLGRFGVPRGLLDMGAKLGSAAAQSTSLGRAALAAVGSLGQAAGETTALAEGATAAATGAASLGVAITGVGLAAGGIVVGLGVAAYAAAKFTEKWAENGEAIKRSSEMIGIGAQDLQTFRGAAERNGVAADAMAGSLQAAAAALNDAKWGRNPVALAALNQTGLQLKTTKDGLVDVKAMILDISDVIARQKNPQTQRTLAAVFGLEAALPLLRKGRAAVEAEMAASEKTTTVYDAKQLEAAERRHKKDVELKGRVGKLKDRAVAKIAPLGEAGVDAANLGLRATDSKAGTAALKMAGAGALMSVNPGAAAPMFIEAGKAAGAAMLDALRKPKAAQAKPGPATAAGKAAGVASKPSAPATAKTSLPVAHAGFAAAIEHQESRGRQFTNTGAPLTSSAGAIGVMQMLPETAKRAAARLGEAFNEVRFRTDANYNRRLGQEELRHLLAKYGGNRTLAAAAYNAGEGRLDGYKDNKGVWHEGWLKRFGDPRKGQITNAEFAKRIPFRETRDYVANTAFSQMAANDAGSTASEAQVAAAPARSSRPGAAAPVKSEIVVTFRNAPAGMTVQGSGGLPDGLQVKVERAMATG